MSTWQTRQHSVVSDTVPLIPNIVSYTSMRPQHVNTSRQRLSNTSHQRFTNTSTVTSTHCEHVNPSRQHVMNTPTSQLNSSRAPQPPRHEHANTSRQLVTNRSIRYQHQHVVTSTSTRHVTSRQRVTNTSTRQYVVTSTSTRHVTSRQHIASTDHVNAIPTRNEIFKEKNRSTWFRVVGKS